MLFSDRLAHYSDRNAYESNFFVCPESLRNASGRHGTVRRQRKGVTERSAIAIRAHWTARWLRPYPVSMEFHRTVTWWTVAAWLHFALKQKRTMSSSVIRIISMQSPNLLTIFWKHWHQPCISWANRCLTNILCGLYRNTNQIFSI